ncbi:plastocyanin [Haladaptatus litoreus]|uniref:Plastocyanin n=2 Tax=Haladaptatus litoreus TaxID=553468 RepID=A0A1N6ZWN6_9EURY|nr:plastocyanin [Haladaptatus litoreus]
MQVPMTSQHDRRTLLKATGATLVVGSLAGCIAGGQLGSGGESQSDEPKVNHEVRADRTLKVGPAGELAFVSDDITVHPGQTVAWEWKSDTHNIVVENQPEGANWEGTPGPASKVYDTGYRYTHTFETLGEYEYYCQPHQSVGMVGKVTVAPVEETTEKPTETPDEESPATEDDLPIEVGPGGNLEFSPDLVKVPAGTEVTFVWKSDSHNIAVESQPDGANWEGTPDSENTVFDAGYEHCHTFDVSGKYEYYCVPHQSVGEKGTIIVE